MQLTAATAFGSGRRRNDRRAAAPTRSSFVHARELLGQWVERLRSFLDIKPKQIGVIGGGKRKPTGVVDVAVIQSLVRRGEVEMADWLLKTSGAEEPGQIFVAIEVPHGPVVETLIERGFAVHAINPKQMDRFRDRFSMAGAKDDSRDAEVMASSAAHRSAMLSQARRPPIPVVVELREWSRIAEELGVERNRLANRLREQLWRYFPALLELEDDLQRRMAARVPRPRADAGQGRPAARDHDRQVAQGATHPPLRRRHDPQSRARAAAAARRRNRRSRQRPRRLADPAPAARSIARFSDAERKTRRPHRPPRRPAEETEPGQE